MPRHRKQRGGDDSLLGDAALIGLGAYAANQPGGNTVTGLFSNLGRIALYVVGGFVALFVVLIVFSILFGKKQKFTDFAVAYAPDAAPPTDVVGGLQPAGPTEKGNERVTTPAGNVIVY